MELRGKSALLTGATGGIGHAIARRLHAEGATPILTGRRADVLDELAKAVDGQAVAADLLDPAEVGKLADGHGDVDVLIANAAMPANGLLDTYSPEQIDRALEVNLRAPIVLARLIGERMLARGSGHIVFISSLSGKAVMPAGSMYHATKFGLRGFALGLRSDWEPRGVGVSCVNPGFVRDAGMFADGGAKPPPGAGTVSPEQVAAGVVQVIERNRGELDVAPLPLRASVLFGSVAPQAAARMAHLLGFDRVANELAEGRRDNR